MQTKVVFFGEHKNNFKHESDVSGDFHSSSYFLFHLAASFVDHSYFVLSVCSCCSVFRRERKRNEA